jgi:hypothetical protein
LLHEEFSMKSLNRFALPLIGLLGSASLATSPALAAPTCSARSAATAAPVVELYTSEGCSSCPPADQWLSKLKAEPSVVALAFHVDYWDRLGWKDRFASPAFTQRQAQTQRSSGARFSYTPQVLLDGADRPDWPGLGASMASRRRPVAPVGVELAREGNRFTATIAAAAGAPARLAAYWAVTEQGHVSAVKAGENQGATLNHDHVVREYLPVATWAAKGDGPATTLQFEPTGAADAAHPREINLVIVDADSGRPVQAVKLGC